MDAVQRFLDALKARDHARAAQILRDHPALAGARAPDGTSLLMQALYARASQVVDALLAGGAAPDAFEAAALGDAARIRRLVATDRALLKATSADGWTALHLAAHFGHREAATVLLNLGAEVDARSTNALRNAPLHAAAAGGQSALVEALLAAGAPPDAQDAFGSTALHVAAANGLVPAVRALLAKGASPTLASKDGKTPRDVARERDEDEAAALLGGA